MSWKKQRSNRWNLICTKLHSWTSSICIKLHSFMMCLRQEIRGWWKPWWELLTDLRYRGIEVTWDCVTIRPLLAFRNCVIQKVSNSKSSIPLGRREGDATRDGWHHADSWAGGWTAARAQAGLNWPRGWGLGWCESQDGNLETEIGTHPTS